MRTILLLCLIAVVSCASVPHREDGPPAKRTITPSATSSENDFDFLVGKWTVQNRMLKTRLKNSNDWVEFTSELHMDTVLLGRGNVEHYYSSWKGTPFEGMAIRLFDRETRLWSVYWVDSNGGGLDGAPLVGSFENKVGKLYADDVFEEKPILILYQWDARDAAHPLWSQAISQDNGVTWEWNWYMTLTRKH